MNSDGAPRASLHTLGGVGRLDPEAECSIQIFAANS